MNGENINLDLSLSLPNSSPHESIESDQSQLSSPHESIESDQSQLFSAPIEEFSDNNEFNTLSEEEWGSNSKLIPYYDFFGLNNGHGKFVKFVIQYNTQTPYYNFFEPTNQHFTTSPPPLLISAPMTEQPSQQVIPQETDVEHEPLTTQTTSPRQARFLPEEGVDNLRAGTGPRLEEIIQLYPWTKSTPTEVHTLNHLLSMNINTISGEVMCKSCKNIKILEYNLIEKFTEVSSYIKDNLRQLRHRASEEWMKPELGMCDECRTATCKPVISQKKEEINWLFLVLGQMVGCCSLAQLRYLCDEHDRHRTGAKDRVVYLTYVVICNQLDPTLNFEL